MKLKKSLAFLAENNEFTRLWIGQSISGFGDRLAQIALSVYILKLSAGSASIVSFILSAFVLPPVLFGWGLGVIIDRFDKKKLMIFCDIIRAVLIILVPYIPSKWGLFVIAFFMATFTTIFQNSSNALIPDLVPQEKLMVANSFVASTLSFVDVLGFAVAGVVVGFLGVKLTFVVDSLTFLCCAILLTGLSSHISKEISENNFFRDFAEGIKYHFTTPIVRNLLFVMIPVALVMGITNSLFIIATRKVMGVSSSYYGFLLGVQSTGMVLSGVIIGRYSASLSRRVLMIVSYLVSGISIALIGYTSNFYLALPLFFFVGFSWIGITLSSITLIQENVPREFLGRVLSVRGMISRLGMFVSMSVVGILADNHGVSIVIFSGGLLFIMTSLLAYFILNPDIKIDQELKASVKTS